MSRHPKKMLAIGPLSRNSAALPHYLPREHSFAGLEPTKVCNASSVGTLVLGPAWADPVRPGADQHRRYQSSGIRC